MRNALDVCFGRILALKGMCEPKWVPADLRLHDHKPAGRNGYLVFMSPDISMSSLRFPLEGAKFYVKHQISKQETRLLTRCNGSSHQVERSAMSNY